MNAFVLFSSFFGAGEEQVEVYSQYWILNLSGVDLAIADGKHQSFVQKIPLFSCLFPKSEMPASSGQPSSDVNLRLKTYKRNGELALTAYT